MDIKSIALVIVAVLLIAVSITLFITNMDQRGQREKARVASKRLDILISGLCKHDMEVEDPCFEPTREWISDNFQDLEYIKAQTSIAWIVLMLVRYNNDSIHEDSKYLSNYNKNDFYARLRFARNLLDHIRQTGIKFSDLEKALNLPLDKIIGELNALSEEDVKRSEEKRKDDLAVFNSLYKKGSRA